MEWALEQGERVRFRCIGNDQEQLGTVRKPLHILAADQTLVPVYIVQPDDGDVVIVGDGEIVDKLGSGD
jgi:hypothetical protein